MRFHLAGPSADSYPTSRRSGSDITAMPGRHCSRCRGCHHGVAIELKTRKMKAMTGAIIVRRELFLCLQRRAAPSRQSIKRMRHHPPSRQRSSSGHAGITRTDRPSKHSVSAHRQQMETLMTVGRRQEGVILVEGLID